MRAAAFHRSYPLFASASDDATVHVFHGMVYSDLMTNPLIVPGAPRAWRRPGLGLGLARGGGARRVAHAGWPPAAMHKLLTPLPRLPLPPPPPP